MIPVPFIKKKQEFRYSWFHIKGNWSIHSFNGDYLSIPEGTGSCEYLFHEIHGMYTNVIVFKVLTPWKRGSICRSSTCLLSGTSWRSLLSGEEVGHTGGHQVRRWNILEVIRWGGETSWRSSGEEVGHPGGHQVRRWDILEVIRWGVKWSYVS